MKTSAANASKNRTVQFFTESGSPFPKNTRQLRLAVQSASAASSKSTVMHSIVIGR